MPDLSRAGRCTSAGRCRCVIGVVPNVASMRFHHNLSEINIPDRVIVVAVSELETVSEQQEVVRCAEVACG